MGVVMVVGVRGAPTCELEDRCVCVCVRVCMHVRVCICM